MRMSVTKSRRDQDVGAEITVFWGGDPHSIVLTPKNWRRVKSGKPLAIRGKGYRYDGEWFWDYWRFNGPTFELVVDYGEDGACGYNGSLSGAVIVEGRYEAGVVRSGTALHDRAGINPRSGT